MDEGSEIHKMFTFTWNLHGFTENNFDCFVKLVGALDSPIFIAPNIDDCEWIVRLYSLCNDGYCTCYLLCIGENKLQERDDVDCQLEITNKVGNICFSEQFNRLTGLDGTCNYVVQRKTLRMKELMPDKSYTSFTIRWRIRTKDLIRVPNTECIAKTNFALRYYLLDWKIKSQAKVERQNIQIQKETYEVVLDMNNRNIKIEIQHDLKNSARTLGCEFSLLGAEKASKSISHEFKKNNEVLQFPVFFTEDMLFSKDNNCLKDDIFTLKCEFFLLNEIPSTNVEYKYSKQIVKNPSLVTYPCTLREDMQTMYESKVLSDVKFQIGKDTLFAHKCVLSVRSPVFLSMFSQDMTEKQTGVVDIVDSDAKTFDAFLKYFYCGFVNDMDYGLAIKLIILANKYQVDRLVSMCISILESELVKDNAIEILLTADAIQNNDLKKLAISIIKTHAADILNSDEWKEFIKNNINLVVEILTYKA